MDPRDDFISSVDLQATRVKSDRGFIFLCGGPHALDGPPKSLRCLIARELSSGRYPGLAERIKLAEEIQDWFREDAYKDLVLMEEHLASLSSVIVLVVESEGAIAELGVFSALERFRDRLLTVVANYHYESHSFIRLGPIRRLENLDETSVLVYDWLRPDHAGRVATQLDGLAAEVRDAAEQIKKIVERPAGERAFDSADPSHVMALICEFCELFGALTFAELDRYLTSIGCHPGKTVLRQYLFLLEKCFYLTPKASGHSRYFLSPEWISQVSFGLKGKRFDRDRLRIDAREYYHARDARRSRVISAMFGHAT